MQQVIVEDFFLLLSSSLFNYDFTDKKEFGGTFTCS